MAMLSIPTTMTMKRSREAVSRDTDNTGAATGDGIGPALDSQGRTRAETLGSIKDSMGFSNKAVQGVAQLGLGMAVPGVAAAYGMTRTGLGVAASLAQTIDEGYIGDMFGSREREAERDAVERAGYSMSDQIGMTRTDNKTRAMGADDSAFGLSSARAGTLSGMLGSAAAGMVGSFGDVQGLNDFGVDALGRDVSASNIGKPGTDFGLSVDSKVGSFGSTKVGRTSLGGLSASLDSSSRAGSDSGGGRDNGNDTGHAGSGARGEGDEGNSSAGGIGGY